MPLNFPQDDGQRTSQFEHNEKLNLLLSELNELLSPVQDIVNSRYEKPRWPVGIILGPPRCGTNIFLQFLASTNLFSYPTNLMTRFAFSPYIGVQFQKLLFDKEYDYQDEFGDIKSSVNFNSELGKSKGALASNEFFHFWRNYIKKSYPEPLTNEEMLDIDYIGISKSLASIEDAFSKPFVTKGQLMQFNLPDFYKEMPFLFFFRIVREPLFICQPKQLYNPIYNE